MTTRVMIIEDNPDLHYSYSMILTAAGYQVISASEGQDIASVITNAVHLYVIDHHLPGQDGLTICRELKANKATAAIPVILMSADNVKALAEEAGADAILEKPFKKEALLKMVADLLNNSSPG